MPYMKQLVDIKLVKSNPNNPRTIKYDNFKKLVNSVISFPKMLEKRPIVVDENMIVLGGNMRLRACKEAKLKEVWIDTTEDWTEEEKREFIIKDNISGGEWDWDVLANEWDSGLLDDWGLDLPQYDEPEIDLPDGEKDGFQQMTFTLSDQQANLLKMALNKAKQYIDGSEDNENGNGNALYHVARIFNEHS